MTAISSFIHGYELSLALVSIIPKHSTLKGRKNIQYTETELSFFIAYNPKLCTLFVLCVLFRICSYQYFPNSSGFHIRQGLLTVALRHTCMWNGTLTVLVKVKQTGWIWINDTQNTCKKMYAWTKQSTTERYAQFSTGPLTVATILVPCYVVKSLQLIWCSGTRRFYLRMTDPQMNYSDLT